MLFSVFQSAQILKYLLLLFLSFFKTVFVSPLFFFSYIQISILGYMFVFTGHLKSAFRYLTNIFYCLPHSQHLTEGDGYRLLLTEPLLITHEHYFLCFVLVWFFIVIFFNFYFLTPKTFCTGVQPISNVVIVSGEQGRDSAIDIHVSILPQTLLLSRLAHNVKKSSMCCTIGFCWLSILNIAVCT